MTAVPSGLQASRSRAALVKTAVPEALLHDHNAVLRWACWRPQEDGAGGVVAVCSACKHTDLRRLRRLPSILAEVLRVYDIVSGIHRLHVKVDIIRSADAVIAVAGMEGALPTVLSGPVKPSNRNCLHLLVMVQLHGLSALSR